MIEITAEQHFSMSLIILHSKYKMSLMWLYLLYVRVRFLVPWWGRMVSSKARGTKVLYLAKVCQYGAGGTIHPIKGITGV